MPSLRITNFGGINTEVAARISRKDIAQIAHNCLLWDGSLRPMAKWVDLNINGFDAQSLNVSPNDETFITSKLKDATFLEASIYPKQTVVGLGPLPEQPYISNIVYTNSLTPVDTSYEVGVQPPRVSGASSISYTRQFLSNKPVNRLYAISAVRYNGQGYEESPLVVIPNQSPEGIIYEGDTANITVAVDDLYMSERSHIRLYRSISGMDTGSSVGNEFDTKWYLIADLRNWTPDDPFLRVFNYIDGGSATTDPLDLYLADRFYPPKNITWNYLGLSEDGWIVAADKTGRIAVTERFMYHAWPTENYLEIPEEITDIEVHYNTVFIGTKKAPYAVSIGTGEALGTQLNAVPFPAEYECLPNTMDATASGAIYASDSGLVTVSKEGMRLVTAGVANGVRPIYTASYLDTRLRAPGLGNITTDTAGGTLPADTYYYVVTSLDSVGQTTKSNEKNITTTGATSRNTLQWSAVEGATGYRVYRGNAGVNSANTYVDVGLVTTYIDTGFAGTAGLPPNENTTVSGSYVEQVTLNFKDTKYGAYFKGSYFGFCELPRVDGLFIPAGYLYDTGSTLDGEHPQQRLVTFDAPIGSVISHTLSGNGIAILTALPNTDELNPALTETKVWTMPLPNTKKGGDYTTAAKLCYQWKSKKFVFPGNMIMSAAKVVHDCDGFVRLKIFVDCCCVYEVLVEDCKPIRLPLHMQGVEWEVMVVGTATVHEIHLASSLRELLENE